MKKLIMLISLLTAIAFPVTTFALVGIEGSVGAWGAMPSGDFSYKSGGVGETDIEDTFGFDDEVFPMVRLKVEVPVIPVMYFMYTPVKFEGDSETSFEFNGQPFGDDSDTELTLDQYDLALYYGIPFLGLASFGKVHVNVGLNMRVMAIDAKMSDSGGVVEENESVTMPIPMLYLAADISPIDLLVFETEIRAFPVNDYSAVSVIGRIRVNTFGPLYVSGGYRYEAIDIDHDDFDFKIDLTGPFAEVGFDF